MDGPGFDFTGARPFGGRSLVNQYSVALVSCLALLSICSSAIAQTEVTILRDEATPRWEAYAQHISKDIEFRVDEKFGAPESKDPFEVDLSSAISGQSETEIRMYHNCFLAIVSDSRGRRVHCRNDLYAFLLEENAPKTWSLKNVHLLEDHERDELPRNVFLQLAPAFESIRLERAYLPDVVDSPTLTVISASEDSVPELGATKTIEFTCNFSVDDANKIDGGTATFLLDHDWVLNDYSLDVRSTDKGKVHGAFEYQEFQGQLIPKRTSTTYDFPNGERTRYVYTYTAPTGSTKKKDGFRLPHFGIPEPAELQRSLFSRPRTWLLGFGVICLLFATLMIARRCAT